MLVIRRKIGERLLLADGTIAISVLEVAGQRVKLGISAPPKVTILREELAARKAQRPQRKVLRNWAISKRRAL